MKQFTLQNLIKVVKLQQEMYNYQLNKYYKSFNLKN